ncbi:MAG: nucleotidyltransferase substrate binding protein, family [Candidatus Magasanikbacteria bacterium]|nr:nucleotidyltransferase substrate binding protein, family [Candidatus Magasanikbacteria bacterium]
MTKYQSLLEDYSKSVGRLEEVLDQPKNVFMRDAAIKRFEFTFDLCWKLVKTVLARQFGVECASPKSCFRESYKQGLIDYEDYWLLMTDKRNLSAHTYDEDGAEKIFLDLPKALKHFKKLLEKISTIK